MIIRGNKRREVRGVILDGRKGAGVGPMKTILMMMSPRRRGYPKKKTNPGLGPTWAVGTFLNRVSGVRMLKERGKDVWGANRRREVTTCAGKKTLKTQDQGRSPKTSGPRGGGNPTKSKKARGGGSGDSVGGKAAVQNNGESPV